VPSTLSLNVVAKPLLIATPLLDFAMGKCRYGWCESPSPPIKAVRLGKRSSPAYERSALLISRFATGCCWSWLGQRSAQRLFMDPLPPYTPLSIYIGRH